MDVASLLTYSNVTTRRQTDTSRAPNGSEWSPPPIPKLSVTHPPKIFATMPHRCEADALTAAATRDMPAMVALDSELSFSASVGNPPQS